MAGEPRSAGTESCKTEWAISPNDSPSERRLAGEHFVENDAYGKQIGTRIERLAAELLR